MFYEFRKCILNRRSILLVVVAVLLKLIISVLSVKNNDVTVVSDERFFMEQVKLLQGKYNAENDEYITSLFDEAAEANAQAALLPQKLRRGEITHDEYEAQGTLLNETLKHKDAIAQLYERYAYVSESPDVRAFGYFDGWSCLFENKTPDLLLIFVIIWLSLSAFQSEYDGGTAALLLTCKNGKAKLAASKIFCVISVSVACTLLFSLSQLTAFFRVFPVEDVFADIHSIEAYSEFTYSVSIISMYMIMIVMRILGGAMISVLTCLFSQFSHNAIPVVTATAMTVVLPIFLMNENEMYRLPLPISMLCGNGAVLPEIRGLTSVVFQQMTQKETLILISVSIIVILLISFLCGVLYCRKPLVR